MRRRTNELLTKSNTSADVFGDSAYRSSAVEERLHVGRFKSRIHVRATRKRSLSEAHANANRNRSKICPRVEHVFAAQQTALGGRIHTHDWASAPKLACRTWPTTFGAW